MAGALWNGADVQWAGPRTSRVGVELLPGTRAVVVDAGRHHISSFVVVATGPRTAPLGHGVLIQLKDGHQVRVPARHLELVAPDHPLQACPDPTVADWWLGQLASWRPILTVAAFVPRSLPAVCRVLHPQSEGELPPQTAATLVSLLTTATATPDDVYFGIWGGWGDVPVARFPGAAHLDTPLRGHFLLQGPLDGALTSIAASPNRDRAVSGIWWPADHAWLVHTEIDFPFTFVAGSDELIARLLGSDELEVVGTTHESSAIL